MGHHTICAVSLFLGLLRCAAGFPVLPTDTPAPRVLSRHHEHPKINTSTDQEPTSVHTRYDSTPLAATSPAGDKSDSLVPGDKSDSLVPGDKSDSFVPGDNSDSLVPSDKSDSFVPGDKSDSLVPGDNSDSLVPGDKSDSLVSGDKSDVLVPGDKSESLVPGDKSDSLMFAPRGSYTEDSRRANNHTVPGEGGTVEERPRAIVDVRRKHLSGEASYIIHPDNQPPPTYKPLKDLPPSTRPVAKWRPDIFMKICCSDPELDASPEDSGDVRDGVVTSPDTEGDEGQATDQPLALPNDSDATVSQEELAAVDEDITTTATPEKGSGHSTTQTSSDTELENTLAPVNGSEARPLAASNHTPRYEEASTSPYQDVANFLRDIASSDGFQNVFIGDLIKNFGSLDQNALKLIYSLLIGPLEDNYKKDRVGTVEDDLSSEIMTPEDTVLLTRDRLPLRDRPDDGFQPLKTSFLQSRPSDGSSFPMRPSVPVRPLGPSDEMWRPGRIYDGRQPVNRRGEERVDVITAPPTKTFEVVLGSSLSHDSKNHRNNGGSGTPPRPANQASHPPLPFDKLTLGLEMPPPEALEALPPGSILIPPSHILGQAKLPKIVPPRGSGAPTLEMPLADMLPNLPFLTKPARPRPPAQPKLQDIPPRLPSFLPSRRPTLPNSLPSPPPRSPIQPSRREDAGLHFFLRQPTGPPPIVTKMTPPHVSTLSALQHSFRRPHHISAPASLSPYLTPPPPPPLPPLLSLSRPPSLPPPPPREGAVDEENHDHSHAFTLLDMDSFARDVEEPGTDSLPTLYMSDRNEDYHARTEVIDSEGHHLHSSHSDYYSDVFPDYLDSYYNLDYDEYYHDDSMANTKQEPPSDDSAHGEHRPFIHEASATFHAAKQQPRNPAHLPTARTTPPPVTDRGIRYSEELLPSTTPDYPSLDDLLGVVKPNFSTPAATKQDSSQVTFLLENYRPSSAPPEEDEDVDVTSKQATHRPHHFTVEDNAVLPPGVFGSRLEPLEGQGHERVEDDSPPVLPKGEHREHDASVSHLWKNLQLIPLTPDLFDATPRQPEERDSLNLTSLFDTAVPLAPDGAPDLAPDLSSDDDRISVDQNGVRITLREEVLEDPEKTDAKFMAYVLIGACCGLALLSITGVIVIVRFKKTCGSRQIKTRTRLTEQDSVENISRHVSQLTAAEESGHKLGSWFTGRNEHIGSGKLRGNMALPAVHDHKREKKGGHSSSTRDLLSISSHSSPSNSPRQERRDDEAIGSREEEEEEPRTSWLHSEYRTSEDELNQAAALDPHYRSQRQHQQTRGSSLASSSRRHSSDHHMHHAETAAEVDSPSRSTRERRYTGQSRDGDRPSRTTNRHGARYMSSLDSEELDDRLTSRASEYPTDSELDDGTTHYDGESREPSRYFSDSRELDDVVDGRRYNHSSMTSQELGEHISRDLKQYQARQNSHSHHQRHPEELKHPQDSDGLGGLSSQELESEESRELRRSQSQVSFSRDNVQNEVFLEFDSMLRQHGQYLGSEPLASTLGRASLLTNDTRLSASRANTPDSIDLPEDFCQDSGTRRECDHSPPSPPTTPPRFSPPPAPPRPPKPGHLSQVDTPSSQAGRGRPPSPGQFPPSPPTSKQQHQQRPVYWTSEEERLI
ncbi:Collagen-like protein 2 [Portunus trituberculatus]|uniref:Collagen-like protein 2 n=1 Tax=Portunus trituberculatus TaxID=210409 RepID=A0A5B7G0G5_PORTR|nr:Collagen-like protein 2 [Portunus trituberculatus]